MATLLAHIKVFEGKTAEFEQAIATLYEATHRLEPGCRRYEYFRGAAPRSYYCFLSYTDYLAFIEHQSSDHHEVPDYASFFESIQLEWLEPVRGASNYPQTRSQSLPTGANDLMKAHAAKTPVKTQDWWSQWL